MRSKIQNTGQRCCACCPWNRTVNIQQPTSNIQRRRNEGERRDAFVANHGAAESKVLDATPSPVGRERAGVRAPFPRLSTPWGGEAERRRLVPRPPLC